MSNDRFKFRIWAKPHEPTKTEGYYVDDADYMVMTPDGKVQIEYYCDNGYSGYIESFEQDEIIIEQCTGLKDKNGKLIYEGDIVRRYVGLGRHGSQKTEDIDVVKWYINGYVLENYCDYFADTDDFEVIGNIHENPDLIELEDK